MSNQNFAQDNKKLSSFLTIFFYVSQKKDTDMQNIIQLFRNYGINFKRFNNKDYTSLLHFIPNNANYIVQSKKPILVENFEIIIRALSSKSVIVAFFYQNQFFNRSRSQKHFSSHSIENVWTQFTNTLF